MAKLPWMCPEHPKAQIRHEWKRTRDHYRLTGVTREYDHGHQYFCAVCGRELAAPPTSVRGLAEEEES